MTILIILTVTLGIITKRSISEMFLTVLATIYACDNIYLYAKEREDSHNNKSSRKWISPTIYLIAVIVYLITGFIAIA